MIHDRKNTLEQGKIRFKGGKFIKKKSGCHRLKNYNLQKFVLHLHDSSKMFFPSMIIKYLTGKLK